MTAHTIKSKNELYVHINGKLIYKRWYKPDSTEKQASRIFNEQWPDAMLPDRGTK